MFCLLIFFGNLWILIVLIICLFKISPNFVISLQTTGLLGPFPLSSMLQPCTSNHKWLQRLSLLMMELAPRSCGECESLDWRRLKTNLRESFSLAIATCWSTPTWMAQRSSISYTIGWWDIALELLYYVQRSILASMKKYHTVPQKFKSSNQ